MAPEENRVFICGYVDVSHLLWEIFIIRKTLNLANVYDEIMVKRILIA